MHHSESSEWREIAATLGMDVEELGRLLPGLNSLGKAFLTARANEQHLFTRAAAAPRNIPHLTRCGWRKLLDRGLASVQGRNGAFRRVQLTEAGLEVLQEAIPLGAIRPIYSIATHKLTLAGQMILKTSVQAKNLSAVLDYATNAFKQQGMSYSVWNGQRATGFTIDTMDQANLWPKNQPMFWDSGWNLAGEIPVAMPSLAEKLPGYDLQ